MDGHPGRTRKIGRTKSEGMDLVDEGHYKDLLKQLQKDDDDVKNKTEGGGHWGVLNTAIPQKRSANTAIPPKRNRKIPQTFNTEWKRDVIPKPLLCMLKFRAITTKITTKDLLMNVRSGNFWFRQNQ